VEARRRGSGTRKATWSALFQPEENQPRSTLARLRRRRKVWSRLLVRPRRTRSASRLLLPGRAASGTLTYRRPCASARCPAPRSEGLEGAYRPGAARQRPSRGGAGVHSGDRAREECGGLMTECDVGQVPSRRSGGLDSRARAVPPLPLRSCGYWEEQRSAVTATAWRPLSPNAAEQALSWPVSAFRAHIGREVRKG
jgi:hypothetical protein